MSKKDKTKKKKKQRVTYVDDGRSLADMSGVKGGFITGNTRKGTYGDAAKTFFTAMKLMLKPMFATLGIISLAFLIMWVLMKISTLI